MRNNPWKWEIDIDGNATDCPYSHGGTILKISANSNNPIEPFSGFIWYPSSPSNSVLREDPGILLHTPSVNREVRVEPLG